ncbi:anti-sigma factor family protein [Pedobacter sp. R-06]|uniref:anti-sigma factor family protein n=1 Tax=Pedobacter sp. R-06 TaxID=3404051 RepID=UPI003CF39623
MNTIEQQLWDYIDGNLDDASKKAIEEKIESDAEIKSQYEDLLKLNLVFDGLDLDEPSMSFNRNVMESIALVPAPMAMKTKVDKKIIYGIGGFFVVSLLAILSYVFYNANLEMPQFDLKVNFDFNLEKYITSTAIYAFLFADLVIGLIFLDQFLRKKVAQK